MVSKINDGAGVRNAGPAKKSKAASTQPGFASSLLSVQEVDSGGDAAQTVASSGVAGMGAVLAAQDVGDSLDGRSKGLLRERGERLLDKLDELRIAVLEGRVAKEKLIGLAQEIRERRPQVEDPGLNEIIDEIEMRAEVELAKLTR